MSDLIKTIILGIIEGITEFLPISSTGHLIVAAALLDFRLGSTGTFEIFIQLGAVIAVILFYRAALWEQVRTVRTDQATQRFWLALVIAVIPAGILGFVVRDFFKENLFNPQVVAVSLIIGGALLIVLEGRMKDARTHALGDITPVQALVIGFAQAFALIPGVSRAAASIISGMLVGLDRVVATQFAFYLAIPTLGGATVIDLLLSLDEISSGDMIYLLVGMVVSGIVAWFAIGWLLRYIARNNFVPFGYYRIAAGIIVLILSALAIL